MKFNDEIVKECDEWLGENGLNFFRNWIDKHGKEWYICCESNRLTSGTVIPHSIHLNEGMQVRNFIRNSEHGKEFDFDFLENHWNELIEKVLDNIE